SATRWGRRNAHRTNNQRPNRPAATPAGCSAFPRTAGRRNRPAGGRLRPRRRRDRGAPRRSWRSPFRGVTLRAEAPEAVAHDPAAAGAIVQVTAGASELPDLRLRLVLAAVADGATLGHADPALLAVEVHLVQLAPVPCGLHDFGHASAPFVSRNGKMYL